MATAVLIRPGIRYRAAAGTITKAEGAGKLLAQDQLGRVGSVLTFGAETQFVSDGPVAVSASAALAPAPLADSVLAGATAALRRIVNTAGVTAAPVNPGDGYSCLGAQVAHLTATIGAGAGNVNLTLYGYDEVSAAWAIVLDFATAGVLTLAAGTTGRVSLDFRGYDRLALRVTANAAGLQADAWAAVVL